MIELRRIKCICVLLFLFICNNLYSQNPPPADDCFNAPLICNDSPYYGSTTGYTVDKPGNMCASCGLFSGSLENNSWLKFIASATTVVFELNVTQCHTCGPSYQSGNPSGIQFGVYEGTNCNNFVLKSNSTYTSVYGTRPNPCNSNGSQCDGCRSVTITATNMIPGQTYYIMIDGVAGDVCQYNWVATSGVGMGTDIIAPSQTVCVGGSTTLTAMGGDSYSWTANPPDPSLAGQENNATINVSPSQTTTYTATISVLGNTCVPPGTHTETTTITVNAAPAVNLNIETPICINDSSTIFLDGAQPGSTTTWNFSGGVVHSGTYAGPYEVSWGNAGIVAVGVIYSDGICDITLTGNVEVLPDTHPQCCSAALPAAGPDAQICALNYNLSATQGSAGAQGSWTQISGPGTSTFSSANSSNTQVTVSQYGSYTFNWTETVGSCEASDEVIITFNEPPTANAGPDITICGGSQELNASGGVSYDWSPPNGLSATNIPNPIASPASTTTYTVTVTNAQQCTATDQVTVVNGEIQITLSSDQSICLGASTQLSVTASSTPITVNWTPANSLDNASSQTPTASPSTSTTYTVVATNSHGCSDSGQLTVTVNPLPNVQANALPPAICAGEQSVLTAQNAQTYVWSPDLSLSATTGSLVTASPPTTTTYSVYATDANSCTNTTSVVLTVNPKPDISISADSSGICFGDSVLLSLSSTVTPTSYQWSPTVGLPNPSAPSLWAKPEQSQTYVIIGTTSQGCKDTIQTIVSVFPTPLVNFTYEGFGCSPVSARFEDVTNDVIVSHFWTLGDGNTANTSTVSHTYYAYDDVKTYDISLTVVNQHGCSATLTKHAAVSVFPMPVAGIIANPMIVFLGEPIHFSGSTSHGISNWEWNFHYPTGDSYTSTNNEVKYTYDGEGAYTVHLTVTTTYGCSDDTTIVVEVVNIQIPNVFTPNSDGFNDKFVVAGIDILENTHLKIFNRWGRIVFESSDYKNDWDGGNCSDGTYFYILTLRGGTSFQGTVNIIR